MKKVISELKLKVLYEISHIINQAMDLDQARKNILKILSESLTMRRATVTLKDKETGNLVTRASYGLSMEEEKRGVYRLDEGVTGLIFRTREPFVVPDIRKDPHFPNKIGSRRVDRGQIAFIGVPILVQDSAIGVLSVDRLFEDDVSLEEDVQFLSIVALLIGLAGQSSALLEIQRLVNRMAQEPQSSLFPAGKQIDTEDYPSCLKSCLKKIEKREILRALERTHWIQSQAAMELGLTLRQIGYRLKQFGLNKMVKERRSQGSGEKSIRGRQNRALISCKGGIGEKGRSHHPS
jgi:transcriptional regulator with GAF, ATPase, and Fis domain